MPECNRLPDYGPIRLLHQAFVLIVCLLETFPRVSLNTVNIKTLSCHLYLCSKKIVVAFSQMLWKAAGCSFSYNTYPPNPSESPLRLFSWTIFLQHKQSIMKLTQRVVIIHQQKDKESNSLLVFTEVSS